MLKSLHIVFICVSMTLAAVKQPIELKHKDKNCVAQDKVEALSERIDRVERESENSYNRLASELDRDLSWIAIVVAVFSLFSGVVVPFVINSEYRKRFEQEISNNRNDFENKISELNEKLSLFSSEYLQFKKDYRVATLFDEVSDIDDVNKRIELFSEILSIDPNNEKALLRRGIAYRSIGSFSDAIKDLHKLISINQNSLAGYSNLGFTYFKAGDYPHASEQYSKALSINPVYSTVLYRMSVLLYETEDYSKALNYIERAINENPDVIRYHYRKRRILRKIVPIDNEAIEKENARIEQLRDDTH